MLKNLQGDTDLRHQLYRDERVQRLVVEKQRHVFFLSLLVLLIHFGFVMTMAFMPEWLSAHIIKGEIQLHGLLVIFIALLIVYGVMFVFLRNRITDNNIKIRELVETIVNE